MNQHCIIAFMRKGLFTPLALALMIACTQAQAQPRPDSAKADTAQEYIGKRNPWAAFGLSFFLPGLGQFYNHEKTKGTVMMGLNLSFGVWYILTAKQDPNTGAEEMPLVPVLGSIFVRVWSGIDAPLSAKRINRKSGFATRSAPGVGLVFVPDPRDPRKARPGFGLRAGF